MQGVAKLDESSFAKFLNFYNDLNKRNNIYSNIKHCKYT